MRCGEQKHVEGTTCPRAEVPQCLNCRGDHLPISKGCPMRKREQDLRNQATTMNVSVSELKNQIERKMKINRQDFPSMNDDNNIHVQFQNKKTYAEIAKREIIPYNDLDIKDTESIHASPTKNLERKNREQRTTFQHNDFLQERLNKIRREQTSPKHKQLEQDHRDALINPNGRINEPNPTNLQYNTHVPNNEFEKNITTIYSLLRETSIESLTEALKYIIIKNKNESMETQIHDSRNTDSHNITLQQNTPQWQIKEPIGQTQ